MFLFVSRQSAEVTKLKKLYSILTVILMLTMTGVITHKFSSHIGTAPMISVDDALANVSVSISNGGYFGDYVSPTQNGNRERVHGFYNYGPITFIIGSALDWVFGTSFVVQRFMYLLGVLAAAFIGALYFRRYSITLSILYFTSILFTYLESHWPMFRPDIITALLGLISVVCLSLAMQSSRKIYWFFSGLLISSAVGNHQITWALIPGAMLVWLLYLVFPTRNNLNITIKDHIKNISLAILGAIIGLIIFLFGIKFRIKDLYELMVSYKAVTNSAPNAEYFTVLSKHWNYAWTTQATLLIAKIGLIFLTIGVVILIAAAFSRKIRNKVWHILVPPVILLVAYTSSLGIYNNHHLGYVILLQYLFIWTSVAVVIAAIEIIKSANSIPKISFTCVSAILVGALALTTYNMTNIYKKETQWQLAKNNWVDFAEYEREIYQNFPSKSYAIGDGIFGLSSGKNTNLVNTGEAYYLYKHLIKRGPIIDKNNKMNLKYNADPEVLILNETIPVAGYFFFYNHPRHDSILEKVNRTYNKKEFKLIGTVIANPYGRTYIYKHSQGKHPGFQFSVYSSGTKHWLTSVDTVKKVKIEQTTPGKVSISSNNKNKTVLANQTLALDLDQDTYIIKVNIKNKTQNHIGMLLATNKKQVNYTLNSENSNYDILPFFGREAQTTILHHHSGGILYLSIFDSEKSVMLDKEQIVVSKIKKPYINKESIQLPDPLDWQVIAKEAKLIKTSSGVEFAGDDSKYGYQLFSPNIQTQKNTLIEVKTNITPLNGNYALGILDKNRSKWLATSLNAEEIIFSTKNNDAFTIVIYNNNTSDDDLKKTKFIINSITAYKHDLT